MIDWDAYGALHLVFLHLPIGLFVGVLALELSLSRERHEETRDTALGILLPLCLLTTLLTVRFGYSLGQTDYSWDAIADHRNTAYIFLGALSVALLAFWWTRARPSMWSGGVYGVALATALVSLILTGHYGGVITHGDNALESVLPEFLKPKAEEPGDVPEVVVPHGEPANPFTDEAWAILDQNCVECHGLNKRKGGYRLDIPRLARAGGDSNKKGIVPGAPDASDLIHRVELPREDEHAMPPGKRPALTPEQIDVLRSWIEAGSQFPGEVVKQEDKLDPEIVAQLEAIRELGAAADFTPWGNDAVLVNLSQMDAPDWKLCFAELSPIADQLVWLNAGNQEWPPEFYADLKDFPKLERLHLQRTNVSDADLAQLQSLDSLEYLNLTETKVTLVGLKTALTLPMLSELYLHGIDINPKQLAKLRSAHPNIDIVGQSSQEFKTEEDK